MRKKEDCQYALALMSQNIMPFRWSDHISIIKTVLLSQSLWEDIA